MRRLGILPQTVLLWWLPTGLYRLRCAQETGLYFTDLERFFIFLGWVVVGQIKCSRQESYAP